MDPGKPPIQFIEKAVTPLISQHKVLKLSFDPCNCCISVLRFFFNFYRMPVFSQDLHRPLFGFCVDMYGLTSVTRKESEA